MAEDLRTLQLSSELCLKAEKMYGQRFGTLENFLTHVLQQLVCGDGAQMDEEEQRIIEERLKDLGYI